MGIRQNSLTSSTILCRYGDTKDGFPIGGFIAIAKTPIAAGSWYYRRLINFVLKLHDHVCLFRVLKGLKDLMVRISLYSLHVKAECFIYFPLDMHKRRRLPKIYPMMHSDMYNCSG